MQIQNTTSPNFQSIKSVKCEGLYEKYPQLGRQLVDTFKQNPTAMEFCKKYDVDIVFYAYKKAMAEVESSIHIFYENPATGKIKKFFQSLFGNKEKIQLTGWGNKYQIDKSIAASTEHLQQSIMPYQANSNGTGLLDTHIHNAEKNIEKALAEKLAKKEKKIAKETAKANAEKTLSDNKDKLNDSIQNLIDSTK